MLHRKRLLISIVVLCIFSLAYLSLAFFVGDRADNDTKVKSDAIIVLGARSYIGDTYNPCLKARVDHAVVLYKEGYASKLIVSGGNDIEDNVNEAETMRNIAIEAGVPSQDILLEKKATSTYENLTYTKTILNTQDLDSVIIVTEPFHIARAGLIAERLGYNYTTSPSPNSPCWLTYTYFSRFFLKEPFAISVYKLQGKL